MKAPDKISYDFNGEQVYIRKDALLEWLNEAKIRANDNGIRAGFQIVISKIESL